MSPIGPISPMGPIGPISPMPLLATGEEHPYQGQHSHDKCRKGHFAVIPVHSTPS